jgi:hypothetical protein
MNDQAESVSSEPILKDRGANYFGTEGAGFNLRAHLRGNGTLALYADRLVFDQYLTGTHIEIPLHEISRLSVGLWHQLATKGVPVLKVTYRGNLVFGVAVAHPERWIEAMENQSRQRGHQPLVEHRNVSLREIRGFRVVAALILILALLLTVALPLFLSWVNRQGVREVEVGESWAPAGIDDESDWLDERTGTDG